MRCCTIPVQWETLRFAGLNEENLASQVIHASFLKIIHDLILRNFLELEEASFSDFFHFLNTIWHLRKIKRGESTDSPCISWNSYAATPYLGEQSGFFNLFHRPEFSWHFGEDSTSNLIRPVGYATEEVKLLKKTLFTSMTTGLGLPALYTYSCIYEYRYIHRLL